MQVGAFYQGASAEVVESAVTIPIEQALNGVEGLQYMTSSSSSDGTASITITFDVTRNIDVAAVDVQNRVSQVEGRLPNEVKTVGISVTKSGNDIVLAAGGVRRTTTSTTRCSSATTSIGSSRTRSSASPASSGVQMFGERRYAMRLWLDPDRLAGRDITANEVVDALREQNVQVAAGQVGAQPARAGPDLPDQRPRRRPAHRARRVRQHHPEAVGDGTLVRLKDVGRTELGAESYSTAAALQRPRRRGLRRHAAADREHAARSTRGVSAELDRLSQALPARG